MHHAIRKVLFPRGLMWFGMGMVLIMSLVTTFAVMYAGSKVNGVLEAMKRPDSEFRFSELVIMFILSSPVAMWALMKQTLAEGKGWAAFVRYLPVSEATIYRAKIRFDLSITLLPVLICSLAFLVGAWIADLMADILPLVWHVISGYLAGYSIFHFFQHRVPYFKRKALAALVLGLAPLIVAIVFKSLLVSTVIGGGGAMLLLYQWARAPRTWEDTFPPNVVPPPPVAYPSRSATIAGGAKPAAATADGRRVLNRWLFAHLQSKSTYALLAFILLSQIFFGRNWDYSGYSSSQGMVLFFLAVITMSTSFVCIKIQHLPLSKERLYPFVALPALFIMLAGLMAGQLTNYMQVNPFHLDQVKAPIRFTFDRSLTEGRSRQQIIVPPQMLEVVSGDQVGEHGGVPLLWTSGPTLVNPYAAGEYDSGEVNIPLVTEQLHRALLAYYGSAPSAQWLRQNFTTEHKTTSYFKSADFEKWQLGFAAENDGKFQSQQDFWKNHMLQVLPGRVLAWVLLWAVTVVFAFTMRFEHLSRGKQILQRTVWGIAAMGFTLSFIIGEIVLYGFVQPDGFSQRLAMAPVEWLRSMLPSNQLLAWLVVCLCTVAIYYLVRTIFRPNQFSGLQARARGNELAFRNWAKI